MAVTGCLSMAAASSLFMSQLRSHPFSGLFCHLLWNRTDPSLPPQLAVGLRVLVISLPAIGCEHLLLLLRLEPTSPSRNRKRNLLLSGRDSCQGASLSKGDLTWGVRERGAQGFQSFLTGENGS